MSLTFDPEQCLGQAPLKASGEAVGWSGGDRHGQGKESTLSDIAGRRRRQKGWRNQNKPYCN